MVRLLFPLEVIVGVLVALLAKGDPTPQTPADPVLTDSMSLVLELENKGEREKLKSRGLLASKMLPLLSEVAICQESSLEKLEFEEVRMKPSAYEVEEPPKIQRVSLVGLSCLG